MKNDDILEKLYSCVTDEKKTGELTILPPGFYASMADKGAAETEDSGRANANKDKLLNTLKAIRLQKILIYLAYNRQLPGQMPEEEEKLYNKIKSIIQGGSGNEQERVTILADLPEVIGPDGSKMGPYTRGETRTVSTKDELTFILKNKIGEQTR